MSSIVFERGPSSARVHSPISTSSRPRRSRKKDKIKSCGVAIYGGPRISVIHDDIYDVDDVVSVYERRTGKLVATRSFVGTSDCPEALPQKEPPKQDAAIDLWLASLP